MAFSLRSVLHVLSLSVILTVCLFSLSTPTASAEQLSGSPDDARMFYADSPVDASAESQFSVILSSYQGRTYAFWRDLRPVAGLQNFTRIFYRDITDLPLEEGDPPPEGGMLTSCKAFTGSYKGQNEPQADANLIVWTETIETNTGGQGYHIYYTSLGDCNAYAVSPTSYKQHDPDISYRLRNPDDSPDTTSGFRVVWRQEITGNQDDIYLYDSVTGLETTIPTPSGKQIRPQIDGDWVAYISNDDYHYGSPNQNDVFAYNIATGETRQITNDADDVLQQDIALKSQMLAIASPDGVSIYDLSRPATPENTPRVFPGGQSSEGVDIDHYRETLPDGTERSGYRIVWDTSPTGGQNKRIVIADTGTDPETVQFVTAGAAHSFRPAISGDRIAWDDARDPAARNIYHNRMGPRAQELAERYAPILVLHKDELFEPQPMEVMLEMPGTYLRQFGDESFPPIENPTVADLSQNPDPDMHIDLAGSTLETNTLCGIDRYRFYRDYLVPPYNQRNDYPRAAYAHVVNRAEGKDKTVIQYWLFYLVNNHDHSFHEGDWEMVEVILDGGLEPAAAAYSQHHGGSWRLWDEIEGTDIGDHPIVYVAKGSHASYFKPGDKTWGIWDNVDDIQAGQWAPLHDIRVLPDEGASSGTGFEWLTYKGLWGERTDVLKACTAYLVKMDGPSTPTAQAEKWQTPLSWAESLNCDMCAAVHLSLGRVLDAKGNMAVSMQSPADIHLYDAVGNHTGKNPQGQIEEQIPNSEYLEIEKTHEKIIVVYGSASPEGYRLEIDGTGEGTFNMLVTVPEHQAGTITTADYIEVPVSNATFGDIELADLNLDLDNDGDGDFDELRPPDATEIEQVDFIPPAPINNLAVSQTTSGSATLSFTAPGDDAGSGQASEYDLRYSTEPITEDNWKFAVPAPPLPGPLPALSSETATISGLDAGTTYYFAIRTLDESGLTSGPSNVASATTKIPQLSWSIQRSYWASWQDYANRHLSIDYRMSNTGTGTAYSSTVQASICVPASVQVVTSLPLAVGDISPGANSILTLKYHVPTNVARFTTQTYATCEDDEGRTLWFPGPMP